jgi:hypothetical protein
MGPGGPREISVEQMKLGEILALVGMAVLLLTGLGRRRVRDGRLAGRGGLIKWVVWRGDFVACALILAGLVLMYWKN